MDSSDFTSLKPSVVQEFGSTTEIPVALETRRPRHRLARRDPTVFVNDQRLGLGPFTRTGPAWLLLSRLFPEETVRLFTALGITHEVKPNEAAVIRMLRLLGREEVEAQLDRDGEILVRDELGGLEYRFTRDDLPRIFTEDDGTAPATRH